MPLDLVSYHLIGEIKTKTKTVLFKMTTVTIRATSNRGKVHSGSADAMELVEKRMRD